MSHVANQKSWRARRLSVVRTHERPAAISRFGRPPTDPIFTIDKGRSLRAMRSSEVEHWVIQTVARFEAGHQNEDDRVELKLRLPADPRKAARQIAGHANQARRDRILWVIGIDEKAGHVVGVPGDMDDLAAWWPQVESVFDELCPSPTFVHVSVDEDKTLLGAGFDTSRPPYVVRLQADAPNREVPWREGTRVRSANRHDLLRLLVPLAGHPEVAVLSGRVDVQIKGSEEDEEALRGTYYDPHAAKPDNMEADHLLWSGRVTIYIDCPFNQTMSFPDHRCAAEVAIGDSPPIAFQAKLYVAPGSHRSESPGGRLAERGDRQLVVAGPGPVSVDFSGESPLDAIGDTGQPGDVRLALETGGLERIRLDVVCQLVPNEAEQRGRRAAWDVVSFL